MLSEFFFLQSSTIYIYDKRLRRGFNLDLFVFITKTN